MPLLLKNTRLPMLLKQPGRFIRAYGWALGILLAGAVADAVTTYMALARWGTECELHVVQRWLSEWFGVAVGVPLAKLVQVVFVMLVAAWWGRWTATLMVLCGVLYGLAAMNNHFMWL